MAWTPELDRLLKINYDGNLSFSKIAAEINRIARTCLSRNACISRAHRLQFPERERMPYEPMAKKKPDPKLRLSKYFAGRLVKTKSQPAVGGVTFEQLEPHHCRFPKSDDPTLFCGQTRMENSPYCEKCHGIAYIKRR